MSKTAVKKGRSKLSLSNVRLCATGQKDFLKFDTVKISANRTLVFYNEQRQDSAGNEKSLENLEKGAAGDYNGDMSRATRSYTQQILNN